MTDLSVSPQENAMLPAPPVTDGGDPSTLPSFESASYELALRSILARQNPIGESDRHTLTQLQQALQLSDTQVRAIHQHVKTEIEQQEIYYHQTQVRQYEEQFAALLEADGTISPANQAVLKQLQLQLGLQDADVQTIEQQAKQFIAQNIAVKQVHADLSPSQAIATPATTVHSDATGPDANNSDVNNLDADHVAIAVTEIDATAANSGYGTSAHLPSGAVPLSLQTGEETSQPSTDNAEIAAAIAAQDNHNTALLDPNSDTPDTPDTTDTTDSLTHPEPDIDSGIEENTQQNTLPGLSIVLDNNRTKYNLLEKHLENAEWREADQETLKIMLTATKEPVSWMSQDAIRTLPCEHLEKLDCLWQHHSHGRFGFGVQYSIFQNMESGDNQVIRFGKRVGWTLLDREFVGFKYYNQLTFDSSSANVPIGHFPARWFWKIPWWESLRSGGLGTGRGGCGEDASTMLITMMKRFDPAGDEDEPDKPDVWTP